MDPTSYLHGKFVWFEHLSNDIPRARAFYEPLLGWHTEMMPMGDTPYALILNGNEGIGGFRSAPPGVGASWLAYLSVSDVDASYAAALRAGGTGLMAPQDVGDVGRSATLADPSGAPFALWKGGTQGDRPDSERTAHGDWYWNELWTDDTRTALRFYETAFGHTHDSMEMGPQGTYIILKAAGARRGGMMKATGPTAPCMWLPYLAVDDCDAAAAKAQSLGASVRIAPTDIPAIGRFAVLIDPLGAAIALMQPAVAKS